MIDLEMVIQTIISPMQTFRESNITIAYGSEFERFPPKSYIENVMRKTKEEGRSKLDFSGLSAIPSARTIGMHAFTYLTENVTQSGGSFLSLIPFTKITPKVWSHWSITVLKWVYYLFLRVCISCCSRGFNRPKGRSTSLYVGSSRLRNDKRRVMKTISPK